MDQKDEKILEAVRLLNKHCKALTVLENYLWKFKQPDVQSGSVRLTSSEFPIWGLDYIAYEHYGVLLHADYNGSCYNVVYREKPGVYKVFRPEYEPFMPPEIETEYFRKQIEEDRRYFYYLKNEFIQYMLDQGECEIRSLTYVYGKPAYIVSIKNGLEFHFFVSKEEVEKKKSDIAVVEHIQKKYRTIPDYKKSDIKRAICLVQDFLIERNVEVLIPEKWRDEKNE